MNIRVIKKSDKESFRHQAFNKADKPLNERQVNRNLTSNFASIVEASLQTIRQNKNQTFDSLFK